MRVTRVAYRVIMFFLFVVFVWWSEHTATKCRQTTKIPQNPAPVAVLCGSPPLPPWNPGLNPCSFTRSFDSLVYNWTLQIKLQYINAKLMYNCFKRTLAFDGECYATIYLPNVLKKVREMHFGITVIIRNNNASLHTAARTWGPLTTSRVCLRSVRTTAPT